MHGNVFEWCEDYYHSNYQGAPDDGSAWIDEDRTNTNRVMRGGSWLVVQETVVLPIAAAIFHATSSTMILVFVWCA